MATWFPAALALLFAFDLVVVLILGTIRSRAARDDPFV